MMMATVMIMVTTVTMTMTVSNVSCAGKNPGPNLEHLTCWIEKKISEASPNLDTPEGHE